MKKSKTTKPNSVSSKNVKKVSKNPKNSQKLQKNKENNRRFKQRAGPSEIVNSSPAKEAPAAKTTDKPLDFLDEEIWNFEIATTESPEACDLASKKILIQIQTDDEPLFKKTKKNVYVSEFLKTMTEVIGINADVFFNERKLFEGKSNKFNDLATDVLALKWDAPKEADKVHDLEKYNLVVYFSSTDLPGSFSYKARLSKTPIWQFKLAKDDGSVSNFFGRKNFFVNPKQARRFVPMLSG